MTSSDVLRKKQVSPTTLPDLLTLSAFPEKAHCLGNSLDPGIRKGGFPSKLQFSTQEER